MKFITDFFAALGEILTSIIDFVVDFFSGLIDFFGRIPEYYDIVVSYLELVPPEFLIWTSLIIATALIFVVIGRRGK